MNGFLESVLTYLESRAGISTQRNATMVRMVVITIARLRLVLVVMISANSAERA